jgi:hypothetical protein
VRATAETFPTTEFYDVEEELTALGTGEALITALDAKGRPMPTVRTMMRPPMSLMAQVDPSVFDAVAVASAIASGYAADTDPESAKEMLAARMAKAEADAKEQMEGVEAPGEVGGGRMRSTRPPEKGVDWGDVAQEGARFARSGAFNTILRAVFGVLTGSGRRR